VTVHEHQLQLDFDELARPLDQLHARRRMHGGAERLLAELVMRGLAERDLPVAAALALTLDRPRGDVMTTWSSEQQWAEYRCCECGEGPILVPIEKDEGWDFCPRCGERSMLSELTVIRKRLPTREELAAVGRA
jgi:hypothetical protein